MKELQEEYRVIEGYEGLYEISNLGNVKSFSKHQEGKKLVSWDNGKGYKRVCLAKEGKKKNHYLHRLVAGHFIPNPLLKKEVNHIDGCKENNAVSNLNWVNSSENKIHAFDTGLMQNGEGHSKAKLTWDKVDDIRSIYKNSNCTYEDLAKMYQVNSTTIRDVIKNITWNRSK